MFDDVAMLAFKNSTLKNIHPVFGLRVKKCGPDISENTQISVILVLRVRVVSER